MEIVPHCVVLRFFWVNQWEFLIRFLRFELRFFFFEMDQSIVAVEESHWKSDFVASSSKPFGSLVQIDSIAIDLNCAMEEVEPPVHEHFSIRGYVAGMRTKDKKMCMPFASEGGGDDVDLPPLSIPRFRWWYCSSCAPDISAKRTTPDMLLTNISDPGTSSCPHVGGGKNGSFLHRIQGDEHSSRETTNLEENYPDSKEKRDVRNTECGNSCSYIKKANRHNNADSSDIVRIAENPKIRFYEPENVSLGSDDDYEASLQRKPKLRSLSDIMDDEKNSTGEHIRKSILSGGMQIRSTGKEADLDPQLQLDAAADIATLPRSPHQKRKFSVVEEDRGTVEATSSVGISKRLTGRIPDSEKTGRTLYVSDSESGGDRSARLDLQLSAKAQQLKPKRNKALDTNRKMKQTMNDNRTVPIREVPKINAVGSSNLQKRANSSETKLIYSALTGEMAPCFNSLESGKQVDRISDLSRSKRPEVEGDHSPIIPPKKNFLGVSNIQGKVALDLSLYSYTGPERNSNSQTSYRHRGIPDLNESFTEKPSMTQGKQLPTISGNGNLTLLKNLDPSCSKQIARESKRQLGASNLHAVQPIHKNVEHSGNSDDIPMEIVELLAKNQRERALGNSRNHLLPESINNSVGGSPPVYVNGHPSLINFSFTNPRSGISVASGKTGLGQGILNFPPEKNCRLDSGNQDESQFNFFSSFKPSQQKKTPFSASNSAINGLGPAEGADLLWPPRRKNTPLHLDVRQNRSIQANGLSIHSLSDQRYKGKTVTDVKGDERRAIRDASAVKEGRNGLTANSAGTLDAYSNDTIPAMQLLSLMDSVIVSGSSFKVGRPNSFLDKPFSPCNHHPPLNANEKQNDSFLSAPFFSPSGHNKNFPTSLSGVHFSGESLRKSYAQGQMPPRTSKAFRLGGPSNLVIQPTRDNLASVICTLNRNPADFSIPDAKNEFMITTKDLKWRKRNPPKERTRAVNVDGQTRQRTRKDASGKELPRK